jgi:hypothetical protein
LAVAVTHKIGHVWAFGGFIEQVGVIILP